MGQVRAPVDLRQREREVGLRDVADEKRVEQAVVGLGLGADHHAGSEVAAVGDDDVAHSSAADLVVDRHAHLCRLPAREHRERREEVRRLREPALRLVHPLRDRAAHPGTRDVREVGRLGFATPRAVRRPAEVDRSRPAGEDDAECVVELRGDLERPHEVDAGAARDDGELRARVRCNESVDHLVHRAVAADRNEQLGACGGGLAREVSEMPGLFREERVSLEPHLGRATGDLGPVGAGRPAGRRRVDEEDGGRTSDCS